MVGGRRGRADGDVPGVKGGGIGQGDGEALGGVLGELLVFLEDAFR